MYIHMYMCIQCCKYVSCHAPVPQDCMYSIAGAMVMLCNGMWRPGLQCSLHTELMCAAHSAAVDVVGQAVVCHGGGGLVYAAGQSWVCHRHACMRMVQILVCYKYVLASDVDMLKSENLNLDILSTLISPFHALHEQLASPPSAADHLHI